MRWRFQVLIAGSALLFATSAMAADYKVVESAELGTFWIAQPGHEQRPPRYPAGSLHDGVESCIEVGFSIEPDGTPARFKILRSSFSDGASKDAVESAKQAAVDTVAATRFDPAPSNSQRQPIYTHRLFTFAIITPVHDAKAERQAHAEHLRQACRIDDLRSFMHPADSGAKTN